MYAAQEQSASVQSKRSDTRIGFFISVPSSVEATAMRIIGNFRSYIMYYTLVVWVILFISLVPRRRIALLFLVLVSLVTSNYLLLLRALPNSVVLHRHIDKRLVLFMLLIVTVVGIIVTRGGIHLLASIGIGLPLILLHAILTVPNDLPTSEDAAAAATAAFVGESDPLVCNKVSDVEIV
ncbi:hypothetical protein Syun_018612 [Stephania yunnanensis]|uniref:PRA1 family protein n=1 Tax=Stephania yunnanensis TaxID=152371 RepID=A0AAP0IT85_9MAGN